MTVIFWRRIYASRIQAHSRCHGMPFNVGVAYNKAPCTKEFALRILSIFTSRTRNPSRTRTRRIFSAAGCWPRLRSHENWYTPAPKVKHRRVAMKPPRLFVILVLRPAITGQRPGPAACHDEHERPQYDLVGLAEQCGEIATDGTKAVCGRPPYRAVGQTQVFTCTCSVPRPWSSRYVLARFSSLNRPLGFMSFDQRRLTARTHKALLRCASPSVPEYL